MSAQNDEIEDSAAPLIEHLAELRTRLIRSVIALLIGIVLAFVVAEPILQFLLAPIEGTLRDLGDPSPTLQYTSPQEYLFTLFRISFVFGFGLAFPVIAHQMWRFIAPGLYKNERGAFLPFIIASPLLFIAGAAFAHFVVTPLAMAFFISFSDIIPMIGTLIGIAPEAALDAPLTGVSGEGLLPGAPVESEITTVFLGSVRETLDLSLKFIFALGICFQLPVLLTLMGIAGLVSSEGLRSVRKYAVVGILVVAALVTPPDVITQLILFTVVYMLYEISIWLVMGVERKRAREEAEAGY